MKWLRPDPFRWRRGFALLPLTVIGTRKVVWLEGYWWRPGGDCAEISFEKEPPLLSLRPEPVGE